jgi:hypothetical protein
MFRRDPENVPTPGNVSQVGLMAGIRAALVPSVKRATKRIGLGAREPILLTAVSLVIAACSAAPEFRPAREQKFTDFWPEFRAAAVAEDTTRLEKLTAFPFELRGTLDTKPAQTYDRAGFRRLAPRLLNQDSGLTEKGESMRELLERTPKPPPEAAGASRFGTFEFRKTLDGWRFVRAYLED